MNDEGFLTEGERYSTGIKETNPIAEASEEQYQAWYDGHFFYTSYLNAAEALRVEASRAFLRGRDEIAFSLRERANALEEQGKRESDEWEKEHSPK